MSPVGVGTWAWGDTLYWQYKDEDEKDAQEAFTASVDAGINFFDTAEIYGSGALGEALWPVRAWLLGIRFR